MSTTIKFKKTTQQGTKPVTAQNPIGFGYSKITQHAWVEGVNTFRFLPQREDSVWGNYVEFYEYNVFSSKAKAKFALLDEQRTMLKQAFFALRQSEFAGNLFNKTTNTHGWQLNPRPKVGFIAIDLTEGVKTEVVSVILPGTSDYTKDGAAPIKGAGTSIIDLCFKKNFKGEPMHGDIFDPSEGGLVAVNVTNAGDMKVKYEPVYDSPMPVEDPVIINSIKPFDQVFSFATTAELKAFLKSYIGDEAFAVIDNPVVFGFETAEPF